ncbi:MAG TPA: DUF4350 domain-containing protein, partial [Thermoanaerobaculia bacterium]|nr:DUF4350 domain-containing protein [Thermoanaerobaculia bacterium]
MKPRAWILGGAALLAASILATLLVTRSGAAGSSSISASPGGWLAARTYWERRGRAVALLDRPLDDAGEGALVLTLPWQTIPMPAELDALKRRISSGGTVVFAYSGQSHPLDALLGEALGLVLVPATGEPPLNPWRWYRSASAEWRLTPDAAFGSGASAVVIGAPGEIPRPPPGARAIYRGGPKASPAIFVFSRGRGRVLVLPADALSNGRLGNPGNADLLESLGVALGPRIVIDEYHHGLVGSAAVPIDSSAPSLDVLLLELALLYLLVAWAVGRRFGPAWQEPPTITSSTTSFLLGLGALHRKLRHSAEAAVHLIGDSESFDPGI